MSIPPEIRARLGGPGFTPTWVLWGRPDRFNPWEDLTNRILTTGEALTLTLDATTAPSRRLTLTEASGPGILGFFEELAATLEASPGDLANYQFRLEAGWIDPAGVPHLEEMGRYWIEELTPGAGEYVTALASTEIHFLRLLDLPDTLTGGLLPTVAEQAVSATATYSPETEFSKLLVNYATNGTTLDGLIGFDQDASVWSPTSANEFPTEWGTSVWTALAEVATRAGWSLATREDGWIDAQQVATPRSSAATLTDGPAGTITRHSRTWRPDATAYTAGLINTSTEPHTVGTSSPDLGSPLKLGVVDTYQGNVPAPDLDALAAVDLRRHNLRGAGLELTATALPWLRADDPVNITLAGSTETLTILTATFNIVAGEMQLDLRKSD